MEVVVVGAGTMGCGIAQVYAMGGYDVTLTDIQEDILQRAREKIKDNLNVFVKYGVLDKHEA
jgi:3-hydroxyacyl-CoA dehydrogenase